MSIIEILDTTTEKLDKDWIFKGEIVRPAVGFTDDLYSFSIAGWVLGTKTPAKLLIISHQGVRVKVIPITSLWPKISMRYPSQPGAQTPGFHTEIGVIGYPSPCEFQLDVQMEDGPIVPLGKIRLKHKPLVSDHEAQVQPLMITSLGRSGSTWSMRLFGEHPEIVFHRVHPYETMAASFWMHLTKVLTDPANHHQSSERLGFPDRPWKIGQNPYFTHPIIEDKGMRQWFGKDLVSRTAAFCQQNIDEYYLNLAQAQKDQKPRYFAEKNRGDHIPRLLNGLYPEAREIFVIRDFRDMACSMFSFNKMRGYIGVGPLGAEDDRDFVRKLRPNIEHLLADYEERKDRAYLMKYEDLVLRPQEVLPDALAYLGIKNDERTISKMVRDANRIPSKVFLKDFLSRVVPKRIQQRKPELFTRLTPHKTSGKDPAKSINRWKKDLPQDLQDVAHEAFGDLLERTGYEIP